MTEGGTTTVIDRRYIKGTAVEPTAATMALLLRGGFLVGLGLAGGGSFFLLGHGRLDPFLHEEGFLALASAQIKELGAADLAFAFHFDLLDAGRVERELPFDAFAVADAPHGEAFIEAAALVRDDDAGKNLHALFFAFLDARVDFDGVAHAERHMFLDLFAFDFFDQFHRGSWFELSFKRSGRTRSVRWRLCSWLHCSILP